MGGADVCEHLGWAARLSLAASCCWHCEPRLHGFSTIPFAELIACGDEVADRGVQTAGAG